MNPEQAYRAHTDWARASARTGASHCDWYREQTAIHCTPVGTQMKEALSTSDRQVARARQIMSGNSGPDGMWALGPILSVSYVVNWEPHTPDGDQRLLDVPTDVYSPEPERPAAGSVQAQAIIIPEHIYTDATHEMLAAAPTYYVTADMVTVMEVAAAAFDDFDLMPRLPSPSGFVVLSRPVEVPDFEGVQKVHAFAWTNWGQVTTTLNEPGTVGEIWSFSSRKHDGGYPPVERARDAWASKTAWRNDPDLLPVYADRFVTGESVGPLIEDICVTKAHLTVNQEMQQKFNARYDAHGAAIPPTPEEWEANVNSVRGRVEEEIVRNRAEHGGEKMVGRMQPYLAAFILLLTQKITAPTTRQVTEGDSRLAWQVAPRRPSSVTVVDVRSSTRSGVAEADGGEVGHSHRRPLDHRHLVGAHWKWQPYGPERSLRRRILVTGYVRGPEDKPLRATPRVTRLS